MRRSTASALVAITISSILLRLSPLLTFAFWGSDVGEYFAILQRLVLSGHISTTYAGWGITYPEFPGMFLVQDSSVLLGGVSVEATLALLVPIAAGLVVLPLFLLTARITRNAVAGLLASAFLAVAMPHVFATSHTAPATLGDLLAVAGLLLFIRLHEDRRAAVPLGLVTPAIVVTHHLSAYFFLVMVLSTVVFRNLIAPARWSAGLRREVGFIAYLLVVTFAFWFGDAPTFGNQLLRAVNVNPWWLIFVVFGGLLAAAVFLVAARPRIGWRYRPRAASRNHALAIFAIALAFLFGFAGYLAVDAIPGTTISLTPLGIIAFSPFLVVLALSAPGRSDLAFLEFGHAPLAWLIALVLSTIVGIVAAPTVLIPYRHMEYLLIPLAVFLGVGLLRLVDLSASRSRPRTIGLLLGGALLLASATIAIPPPSFTAGWQEGIQSSALPPAYWLRDHGSGLVAADHRASTIVFGFAGLNATWDTAPGPFLSSVYQAGDYTHLHAPSGFANVSYVWLDSDTRSGVELYPWEPAVPMSTAAVLKFSDPPFVKVYDSGYAQLYWISPSSGA